MQRKVSALWAVRSALSAVFCGVPVHATEAQETAPAAASAAPLGLSGPLDSTAPFDFAFEACLDKQEGMTCSVSFDGHELQGRCVLALDNRLFCLPDSF